MKQVWRAVVFTMLLGWGMTAYGGALPDVGTNDWPAGLKILAGATGGQWDALGIAISGALNRSVLPTTCYLGGGISNIANIAAGSGDIGFSMCCFLHNKKLYKDLYGNLSIDNAMLLARIYPQVLYVLVRKEFAQKHGIKSMEDLLKQRIPVHCATLKKGTGSRFLFQLLLMEGYQSSFDQLRRQGWKIHFHSYSEIADKFANKELDCFVYMAGSNVPIILSMEKYVDITILPISKKILQSLQDKYNINIHYIDPKIYQCVNGPIYTISDYTCLVVNKELPKNLVYNITKTIWEQRAYIGYGVKDFLYLSPNTAIDAKARVHPGAIAFWREIQNTQE